MEEAFSHIAREYLGAHDVQEDEKEKEEEKIAASPGDFVKDLLLKPLRKSVPLLEGGLKPLVETPAFGCYHPLLKEQIISSSATHAVLAAITPSSIHALPRDMLVPEMRSTSPSCHGTISGTTACTSAGRWK